MLMWDNAARGILRNDIRGTLFRVMDFNLNQSLSIANQCSSQACVNAM